MLPGAGHQVQFIDKSPRTNPKLYQISISITAGKNARQRDAEALGPAASRCVRFLHTLVLQGRTERCENFLGIRRVHLDLAFFGE